MKRFFSFLLLGFILSGPLTAHQNDSWSTYHQTPLTPSDSLGHWIPVGTNLEGEFVSYTTFNRRTPCDDCSEQITLPFSFNFYGQIYHEVYINANGNLSFGDYVHNFTPKPFCLNEFRMIAPFLPMSISSNAVPSTIFYPITT